MAAQRKGTDDPQTPATTLRRRGMVAAAAALAFGMAVNVGTSQRVAALIQNESFEATGGSFSFPSGFRTTGQYDYGVSVAGTTYGVFGANYGGSDADGVYGKVDRGGVGVRGTHTGNGIGVYGTTAAANIDTPAIFGVNTSSNADGVAVQGRVTSVGIGVLGGDKGGATAFNGSGVEGRADGGYGVYGVSNYRGVVGESTGGNGVYGSSSTDVGVYGDSASWQGVYGETRGSGSSARGVYGNTNGGSGSIGVYAAGNGSGTYGVFGRGYGGVAGVYGTNTGAGIGVYGQAPQFGVVGNASASGGYGIYGVATTDNSAAFAGGTSNANAYAAVFGGRVVVNGPFTVTGAKSAALPHPDGSHRLVYCVEAPESWLEDFGEGTLVAGRAEVKLDPDFLAVADAKTLHVFVSEVGQSSNLGVTAKSATGFTVEADSTLLAMRGRRMADVTNGFSYRVVARRKDIPANRLAKVNIPQVKIEAPPTPPDAPKPPAMPPQGLPSQPKR